MQLFVQTVPRHASWLLVGPPGATSLMPQQDITVTFTDSSSVVVPAGTPAALPGGGTTWDRTQEVVVGYVVQGSGTLLACPESQLGGLSTDYAPLVRVLADSVQVYQPQQPAGQPDVSGAWSGGATITSARALQGGGSYGAYDAQSVRGGGSVSGVPFKLHSNGTNGSTYGGFFVKVAAYPAGDTTLFDISSGTAYIRVKLTSAGHIVIEEAFRGGSWSADLTPSAGITTGAWYWVYYDAGNNSSEPAHLRIRGIVYDNTGASLGAQTTDYPYATGFADDMTGVLGWGVSTSGSGYAAFPTTAGNELSKLEYYTGAVDSSALVLSPPSSDPSVGSHTALYLCRQTIGTVTSITDSTSNAYHLSATAGSQIVADGPFA